MPKAKKTVVVLNGSPRKRGNTVAVLEWFEQALEKRGFSVRRHDLYRMDFKGCAHCDHCKKHDRGAHCKLQDDLRPVLDEIVAAGRIVVDSPVYCWSVSGCMSAALDRFYCMFKDSGKTLLKGKTMVGLFTAGGDAFDGMDLCVDMLKRLCEYGEAAYLGTVAGINCDLAPDTRQRKDLRQAAEALAAELR